ncbi:hypothetical protein KUG88_25015 [Rhodococcus rhodochrous]|uniref:hypothetical protein n=1 Tax=Rhodococcus rhodochrous TaxID=1829 RepID=UPI001E2D582E|nr:hypothetical protein [Rhodococcus rhodochrous]MCB8913383.1 hypothetical protein [Rhodococcus rhodochrous]
MCAPVPDGQAGEAICVDLSSGELLASPQGGHIEAGTRAAMVRRGLDRCVAAIEAELPAYDVPDPFGFSAMLNAYLRSACRTDLVSVLERLAAIVRLSLG